MNNNSHWRYHKIARVIHWLMALLLIGLIGLGWYMVSIEDQPNSAWYFKLHKSFGLVAAMLVFFRLIWRFRHQPAPLPSSVPFWQAKLSRTIHFLLYLCMLVMPMTGFIGASLSNYGAGFFGIELAGWIKQNHPLSEQFFNVHGVIAWILVGLITLHSLAAMKHLLINKDKVFQRMWF